MTEKYNMVEDMENGEKRGGGAEKGGSKGLQIRAHVIHTICRVVT